MEHVKMSDVNSDMEVAKQFNRIIDKLNENDAKNTAIDEFNSEVAVFNDGVEKGE